MFTKNFQKHKLDLEKTEESEIKLPTSRESWKSKRISEKTNKQTNIYFCFMNYTEAFECVDNQKLWKILKRWEYQTILPAS